MSRRHNYAGYGICLAGGIALFFMAEFVSGSESGFSGNYLRRNPPGSGDAIYHLYVSGAGDEEIPVDLAVPEQKISGEQREDVTAEAAALLCDRILGENESLMEVRADLNLVREIPEYGLTVAWASERPERVSSMGLVQTEGCGPDGESVYLTATLTNGLWEETIQIPVTVLPELTTGKDRLMGRLEECVRGGPEEERAFLPKEYEGRALSYREKRRGGNEILILLGAAAALCLYLRERDGERVRKKKREDFLLADYSEVVSKFLVLLGAGYPLKAVWRRLSGEAKNGDTAGRHPVYEEMQVALNQMETGMPEYKAYADFGRRCGLRCYIRFAALLANNLRTGNKNLRALLENEMEEAFNQRKDFAKRLGEEAATKLLLPLVLMLGVVMVMVVAPAFMSMG